MYCANCGQELSDEDMTCSNCGAAPLRERFVDYPRPSTIRRKMKPETVRTLSVALMTIFGFPTCLGGGCLLIVASGGGDTHLELSIGMFLLVIFAGLVYFVWSTNKRRRKLPP